MSLPLELYLDLAFAVAFALPFFSFAATAAVLGAGVGVVPKAWPCKCPNIFMTLVLASLVSTGGAGKDNWPGDPWLGPGDPWLGLPSCWPGDPWPGRSSGAGGPGCPIICSLFQCYVGVFIAICDRMHAIERERERDTYTWEVASLGTSGNNEPGHPRNQGAWIYIYIFFGITMPRYINYQ